MKPEYSYFYHLEKLLPFMLCPPNFHPPVYRSGLPIFTCELTYISPTRLSSYKLVTEKFYPDQISSHSFRNFNTSLYLNMSIYMPESTYLQLNSPSFSHSKPALPPYIPYFTYCNPPSHPGWPTIFQSC